ncbi:MAG: outer membrane beta-barrel protein [Ferruginibacter sp.]
MKKIFLLSSIVMIFSIATKAQIRVGIQAGANLSNQSRNDFKGSKLISNKAFKGFHAGVVADIPLTSHLYLQPQLQYTRKGARYTGAFGTDAKLTMHYVEMPVNILYKVDMPFGIELRLCW